MDSPDPRIPHDIAGAEKLDREYGDLLNACAAGEASPPTLEQLHQMYKLVKPSFLPLVHLLLRQAASFRNEEIQRIFQAEPLAEWMKEILFAADKTTSITPFRLDASNGHSTLHVLGLETLIAREDRIESGSGSSFNTSPKQSAPLVVEPYVQPADLIPREPGELPPSAAGAALKLLTIEFETGLLSIRDDILRAPADTMGGGKSIEKLFTHLVRINKQGSGNHSCISAEESVKLGNSCNRREFAEVFNRHGAKKVGLFVAWFIQQWVHGGPGKRVRQSDFLRDLGFVMDIEMDGWMEEAMNEMKESN